MPTSNDAADLLRVPRPVRAAVVDSIISDTRKRTPASAVEQRKTPRYSIAELNAASWDQVQERFRRTKVDDRGPVARFLDLLDLPRNIVGNILAPSLAVRKREAGETGTAGLGVVRTADILESLGIENRIVRGVVGFAGDVAMDPLTYLGPPGWGAKAAGTSGRAVRFTGSGLRNIKRAARAGVETADEIGRYYRALGAYAKAKPEDAAKYAIDLGTESGRRAAILGGSAKQTTFGGKAKAGVGRFMGGDITGESSPLSDFLHRSIVPGKTDDIERELIESAKAVGGKWGQAAAPGVRFGREGGKLGVEVASRGPGRFAAGSTVAHIPFTDWGIHVPALTQEARQGVRAAAFAKNATATGVVPGERAAVIADNMASIETLVNQSRAAVSRNDDIEARINAIAQSGAFDANEFSALRAEHAANSEEIASNQRAVADLIASARDRAMELSADPFSDIGEIGYAGQSLESANAAFKAAKAESEAFAKVAANRRFVPPTKPVEDRIADLFNAGAGSVDEAASEYQRYAGDIEAFNKSMLELSDADIASRAAFADTLHNYAAARELSAGHLQGALANTMLDRQLRDAAASMIGLSPDFSGYTTFSSIGGVLDAIDSEVKNAALKDLTRSARGGVSKASHVMHKWFGLKDSSDLSRLLRAYLRTASNPSGGVAMEAVTRPFAEALDGISRKHGIPRDEVADLFSLLRASGRELRPGSPEVLVLDKAIKAGRLDPKTKPGLLEDIKALSDSMTPELEAVMREGQSIGAMGEGMDPSRYWPGGLTLAASKTVDARRADLFKSAGAGGSRSIVEQDFARRKGLVEYVFDADGKQHRFMEADRWLMDLTDADLAAMNAGDAEAARGKIEAMRAYDAMPEKPPGRPISAMEANQIAAEGGFQLMLGGPMEHAFSDPVVSLGLRFHQHEKARLAADITELVNQVAMPVDSARALKVVMGPDGAQFTLPNGASGRLFYMSPTDQSTKRLAIQIGDEVYRKPNIQAPTESGWNPFGAFHNSDRLQSWLPDRIATELERINGAFASESQARELLKAIDDITMMWKGVTLLHPSWTINDMISTVVLAGAAGISPLSIARHFKDAVKIVSRWNKGDTQALDSMRVLKGAARGIDAIHPGPVQGGGMYAGTIGEALADGSVASPIQNRLLDARTITDPAYRRAVLSEINGRVRQRVMADMKQSALRNVPGAARLKHAKGIVLDEGLRERVFKPWYQMNAFANDVIRTSAYLGAVEQGRSFEDAARYIGENLLDMHLYTQADRNIKRFVPFYAWMKASGAFGVRQLLENPKFFTTAPHAKRAIEEMVNGEGRLPEHQRPSWMREQLAIQLGSEDASRRFLLAGQIVPSEAATYFATMLGSPALGWEAMQDALGYFANSLSPAFRVPIELGQGRELFTQRSIGTHGDLTQGEFLLGQIRPLRELGLTGGPRKGGLEKALDRGVVDAGARLLFGGKLQPGDHGFIGGSILRESDEIEKSLRRRIGIAEREGRDSSADRARLLKLYQRRQQQGIGEESPKWAQEQLAALQ